MGDVVSNIGKGIGDAWNATTDFVGDITGYNAGQRAEDASEAAASNLADAAERSKGQDTNIANQMATATSQANTDQSQANSLYAGQTAANQSVKDSMGANAGEQMQKAQDASSKQAVSAANAAGGQAAAGARAAGLNAGQAAQMAAQGTSGTYQGQLNSGMNQYNANVGQAQSQASNLASQQGSMAGQAATQQGIAQNSVGQGLQAAGTTGSIGTGQTGLANQNQATSNQQGQSFLSGASTALGAFTSDESMKYGIKDLSGSGQTKDSDYKALDFGAATKGLKDKLSGMLSSSGGSPAAGGASAAAGGAEAAGAMSAGAGMGASTGIAAAAPEAAMMFASDENVKTDTQPASMKEVLSSMLANVKPVSYKYKPGVETAKPEGTDRVGILAQDLEKTPLKDTVIDTPQGKKVDTGQMTANNTALIIELAGQIRDLQKKLGGE